MRALATEDDYQATVIAAACLSGWRVHHSRPAQTTKGWRTAIQGHAGFPDLVLAHPQRGVIFAELKRDDGRMSEAQWAWHDALAAAGADVRVVRVPAELEAFIAELTARSAA